VSTHHVFSVTITDVNPVATWAVVCDRCSETCHKCGTDPRNIIHNFQIEGDTP
jgi:hypothetical protein